MFIQRSNVDSSLDSSDGGDSELSASPALEAQSDEETEDQESEDETDKLPDVPWEWVSSVFMCEVGGLLEVKVGSHILFNWL